VSRRAGGPSLRDLRRLGRVEETRASYRRALDLVHDQAERRLFELRLARESLAST
jgi:predicted RNA polymerase sigma factor